MVMNARRQAWEGGPVREWMPVDVWTHSWADRWKHEHYIQVAGMDTWMTGSRMDGYRNDRMKRWVSTCQRVAGPGTEV